MRHLDHDDFVLHYYGEDSGELVSVEAHLRSCERCATEYATLARALDAVVAPTFTADAVSAFSVPELLRERLATSARPNARRDTRHEVGLAALVWVFALVYPTSLQVLFDAGRWASMREAFVPLLLAALLWTCAGPLLAAMSLQRMRFAQRPMTRLLAIGALLAATAPALFLLVRFVAVRVAGVPGSWPWYALLGLAAVGAWVPWPAVNLSAAGTKPMHRTSAMVLMAFLFGHVINQSLAFVSPVSYAAMRSIMRLASVNLISYTVILVLLAMLIGTGVVASMKNVGSGLFRRNLQATSGWYLAAFLLMHVFTGLFVTGPATTAAPAVAPVAFNLLATPRGVSQLPFLLLGVAAFLFHVGVCARMVALTYAAERSVRRWSYAGAAAAAVVVTMVGLSLCGLHL